MLFALRTSLGIRSLKRFGCCGVTNRHVDAIFDEVLGRKLGLLEPDRHLVVVDGPAVVPAGAFEALLSECGSQEVT
jgi:hypothetical protein